MSRVAVVTGGASGLGKASAERLSHDGIQVFSLDRAGGDIIVDVTDASGKDGNPRLAAYSASKAAVIGLTKSLGEELATSGVLVNEIAPAVIGAVSRRAPSTTSVADEPPTDMPFNWARILFYAAESTSVQIRWVLSGRWPLADG